MRSRKIQLLSTLAVITVCAVTGPTLAQAGPDTRPTSPDRSKLELHPLGTMNTLRDSDDPRHERWEKAAYLGVATSAAPQALRRQLGLSRGVGLVVDFIEPKSPADAAGLRQYDVIHKFDDQILVNAQQLAVLVRIHQGGDEIKLAVIRDGKPVSIDATLAEKEVPPLEELRLGQMEGPGAGATPLIGENQWPGLPIVPGRRVGVGFTPPNMDGSFRIVWNDASADIVVSDHGTHRALVVRDKTGEVLFHGPVDTAEQRNAIPKNVSERLEALPEPFRLPAIQAAPATQPADSQKTPTTAPAARKVSPGDHLQITMADLTGPGTQTVAKRHVDESGKIRLPYLSGPLEATGLTPAELERAIADAYHNENIIQRAQVSVEIIDANSN